MREEWRYILPVTGLTLVAGTWPSVETTLNLRSAELDPKPLGMSHEHRQPFLPEGHNHSKAGPPQNMVTMVASSTSANSLYSLPPGVAVEELNGYLRVTVPWWWPPKA